MEALKDARHLYETEHQVYHCERPGFRISEMTISAKQTVPWHYHNNICDTFYVIEGHLRLYLQKPKESVDLMPGESYAVAAPRPHLVTNGQETSTTFLVLQGVGDYDYVPMV